MWYDFRCNFTRTKHFCLCFNLCSCFVILGTFPLCSAVNVDTDNLTTLTYQHRHYCQNNQNDINPLHWDLNSGKFLWVSGKNCRWFWWLVMILWGCLKFKLEPQWKFLGNKSERVKKPQNILCFASTYLIYLSRCPKLKSNCRCYIVSKISAQILTNNI